MTKRLQVLLSDDELDRIQQAARASDQTVAEWVRNALRQARSDRRAPEQKLAALRRATRNEFPTADIDEMLAQIESGYRESAPPRGATQRRGRRRSG